MTQALQKTPLDLDMMEVVKRESHERELAIAELRERYHDCTIEKDGYDQVRYGIGQLRGLRTAIEKRRVEANADALSWQRMVNSEAKRLTGLIFPIEDTLKLRKQAVDDEKARIKREEEEAKRAAIEANIRLEREHEEARQRAENEAIEERHRIEAARLAQERAILDAQRAEIEAQKRAERELVEAEQKAERDRVAAERQAIQVERQNLTAARDRLEREEFERQANFRAVQEAVERAQHEKEQAELRRLETERKAAEERKRLEALKPDRDKVRAFSQSLLGVSVPVTKSKEARAVVSRAWDDLKKIVADLESFAKP